MFCNVSFLCICWYINLFLFVLLSFECSFVASFYIVYFVCFSVMSQYKLWEQNIHQTVPPQLLRELEAIYLSIRHFHHRLEGRNFTVFTDHKPITYALHVNTEKYMPRDTQQLDYISQFTSDIRYIKGSDSIVADTLSRSTIQSIDSENLTFELMTDEQRKDATLDKLNDTSLQLKEHPVPFGTKTILCNVRTGHSRSYIPLSLRKKLLHISTTFHTLDAKQPLN